MASVNKVFLLGNLGRDVETKQMENGRMRVKFTLATSETYKKDGERITQATWHNIVAWSPLADRLPKLIKKGDQVYIEGKISNRSYQDASGQTKYMTEIIVKELLLLNSKRDNNLVDTAYPQEIKNDYIAPSTEEVDEEEDELLF